MRTKVIYKNEWELDISSILLSTSRQNSFFSDDFFGTISYPFELATKDLPDNFLYHYNRHNFKKLYEGCILERGGKIEECKLLVLEYQQHKISFQLVVGLEDFPNFDKKLSELALSKVSLAGQNIYQLANNLVGKIYPETNYSFPAIHTDSITTSEYIFSEFKGTYNLYQNGSMLQNIIDSSYLVKNYNLISPAVAFLYVLKTGFGEAGYTLEGDIMEDYLIIKLYLFNGKTYQDKTYPEPVKWLVEKFYSKQENGFYRDTQEISFQGSFRIKGIAYLTGWGSLYQIKDLSTGTIVWKAQTNGNSETVDFTLTTNSNTVLQFEGFDPGAGFTGEKIVDLEILPITIYNADGSVNNPDPNILNELNLADYMPDVTFGEAVKALKNTFNVDVDQASKVIKINYIENHLKDSSNLLDFTDYQDEFPKITFNEASSYLLKYAYEGEDYSFEELYVDNTGAYTTGFNKQKNTQEISSSLLPLPSSSKNQITTAGLLKSMGSNIPVVIYEGVKNGKNATEENTSLLRPQLYNKYWKKWLEFCIFSDSFQWTIKAKKGEMLDLTIKSKLYAYGRIHLIKNLDREDLSQDTEEIELETQS